jgi:hypothetical protein
MKEEQIRQIEITAFHEAGHAVSAYLKHCRIKRISIIPDHHSRGRVTVFSWLGNGYSSRGCKSKNELKIVRRNIEREVMVMCAGYTAEFLLNNEEEFPLNLTTPDMQTAHKLCECLSIIKESETATAVLERILADTQEILKAPVNWGAVKALAAELLRYGEIDSRWARTIISHAMRCESIKLEQTRNRNTQTAESS